MSKTTNKLAQHVVSYVEVTGKALGVAVEAVKQAHVEKKAAADKIGPLVARLVEIDLLPASQTKTASDQLLSHADALDITMNIIDEMAERLKTANAKFAAINNGHAVDEGSSKGRKQASADSEESADAALLRLVPGLQSKYLN